MSRLKTTKTFLTCWNHHTYLLKLVIRYSSKFLILQNRAQVSKWKNKQEPLLRHQLLALLYPWKNISLAICSHILFVNILQNEYYRESLNHLSLTLISFLLTQFRQHTIYKFSYKIHISRYTIYKIMVTIILVTISLNSVKMTIRKR